MLYIGDLPKFKNVMALWTFNGSQWENPKMCNILKTVDRRAKRAKIWDSGYYSAHIGRVLLKPDSWNWVGFGHSIGALKLICNLWFPMLGFSKGYTTATVFIQFQPNFIVSICWSWGNSGCNCFWRSRQKFKNVLYGTLKFLLTQNHIWDWKFQTRPSLLLQYSSDMGQTLW